MARDIEEKALDACIGRRLRWARELTYGTGAAFARVMGISQSNLNRIERGERSLSYLSLVSAANKLQCGTEYLLTGDLSAVEQELRVALVRLHPELLEGPSRPMAHPRPLMIPGPTRLPRFARAAPPVPHDTDTDRQGSGTVPDADTEEVFPHRKPVRVAAAL